MKANTLRLVSNLTCGSLLLLTLGFYAGMLLAAHLLKPYVEPPTPVIPRRAVTNRGYIIWTNTQVWMVRETNR